MMNIGTAFRMGIPPACGLVFTHNKAQFCWMAALIFLILLQTQNQFSVTSFCYAGEVDVLQPDRTSNGPLVEIHPKSGPSYKCFLLKYKEDTLELRTLDGVAMTRKASEVNRIQFIPPPPPPEVMTETRVADTFTSPSIHDEITETSPNSATMEHSEKSDRQHIPWTSDGPSRLRELMQKKWTEKLSPEEENESRALLSRAPEPIRNRIKKYHMCVEVVREARSKGDLDNFLAKNQVILNKTKNEDEMKDLLFRRAVAYRFKNYMPTDLQSKLLQDVDAIPDAQIRAQARELVPVVFDEVFTVKYKLNNHREQKP